MAKRENVGEFSGLRFYSSPLPFTGQKRYWVKQVSKLVTEAGQCSAIVDLFGGSGLLSVTARDTSPGARVVYNDFDGFAERCKRYGPESDTYAVCRVIEAICAGVGIEKRIPEDATKEIKSLIAFLKTRTELDYITLSSYLLSFARFTNAESILAKSAYYRKSFPAPIDGAKYEAYFGGLERVQMDAAALYERFKRTGALFLCDPPYLGTGTFAYSGKSGQFDFFEDMFANERFIFFTSSKSPYSSYHFPCSVIRIDKKSSMSATVSFVEYAFARLHCGETEREAPPPVASSERRAVQCSLF